MSCRLMIDRLTVSRSSACAFILICVLVIPLWFCWLAISNSLIQEFFESSASLYWKLICLVIHGLVATIILNLICKTPNIEDEMSAWIAEPE